MLFVLSDPALHISTDFRRHIKRLSRCDPLGPLVANAFLCHIEETLESRNLLPSYYKRYVDDTLAVMRDQHAAQDFLNLLNACHPSIQFTMELSLDGKLPFLGILLEKRGNRIMTSVTQEAH